MQTPIKVLLVEDDHNLGFVIKDNLTVRGFAVTLATDGEEGWAIFQRETFQICLLDVMVPKLDGFSLIRKIRAKDGYIPVFFLTAKSMLEDKLTGLKIGADDYIIKPFSMDELELRIGIALKRSTNGQANTVPERYQMGSIQFVPKELKLVNNEGEKQLTQREADLLRFFCTHANQVIKREAILEALWGTNDYFMGRSLDVFIARLRKYLQAEPAIKIINLHSVGFRFECPLD